MAIPIQEISDLDVVFPGNVAALMPKWEEIPEEFRRGHGRWDDVVNDWFFHGLKNSQWTPKPGVDTNKALRHIKAILASFEPKHEHKTAAVAYLLSEWFENVTYEKAK